MVRRVFIVVGLGLMLGFVPSAAQAGTLFDSLMASLQAKKNGSKKKGKEMKGKEVGNKTALSRRTAGLLGTKSVTKKRSTLNGIRLPRLGPDRASADKPALPVLKRPTLLKPILPKRGR